MEFQRRRFARDRERNGEEAFAEAEGRLGDRDEPALCAQAHGQLRDRIDLVVISRFGRNRRALMGALSTYMSRHAHRPMP